MEREGKEAARTGEQPEPLLSDREGQTELLLGNEAIVRGALEAGIGFACGYPGTPSSEVTDTFARIAGRAGIGFEYSVNEKVALDMAFAASLAGARSLCAMKHLGLMVAGDPLSTIPYIGVEAGMVIVSAADPSCRTSPNEQDQRYLGPMLHLPVLDPATPAEAHAMTRLAFELSERSRLPVLLRTTARVAHTRAPVRFGPLVPRAASGFVRNPSRYVPMPANARRMRLELPDRLRRALGTALEAGLFRREGAAPVAVLVSGAAAATFADLADALGLRGEVEVWTLGMVHPLPEQELASALAEVERVLVLEELSPFLEDAVRAIVARNRLSTEILGKRSGHTPEAFEYGPDVIAKALRAALGVGSAPEPAAPAARPEPEAPAAQPDPVAARAPSLCPGCGHRAAYFAVRAAFDDAQLYFNDIGCYTLGYGSPHDTADALVAMGSGLTLAAGVARVTGERTVGFIGDSTFFHSGMPALLDAVKEDANIVAVVLDNRVTAMTGFQDSPAGPDGDGPSIEAVARALGARHVETADPYDFVASVAALRRARDGSGTSVVVLRRTCPVYETRRASTERADLFAVDPDRCRSCGREEAGMRCAVPMTLGYERQLSRARSTQSWATPPPAVAPCAEACPLSLCVQGYAGHVAAGEPREALAHVLERTPLPESVCRVCHRPCEDTCVRAEVDEPIAVNDLKRWIVAQSAGEPWPAPSFEPPHGLRVAVVGAGPAGLAAAADLRRRGYEVTLLDAHGRPGGLLAHAIPTYRLPPEAVERDVDYVLSLGVRFEGGVRLGREVTLDEIVRGHDAVCLCVGATRPRRLDLPGPPDGPETIEALSFLEDVRAGRLDRLEGSVVVVGGGNAAVDAARTALRLGASPVAIECIEEREAMPALPTEVAAALDEGIDLRTGVALGSVPDASLVIAAVGQEPELSCLEPGPALERTAQGLVAVDPETCATSDPRVFAAGDVTPAERTVTAALASGLRAAWGIDRALRGAGAADRRPPPPRPRTTRRRFGVSVAVERRRRAPEALAETRAKGFGEVAAVLSERDAVAEARRCLLCGTCGNCRACIDTFGCPALQLRDGVVSIDPALCSGCGVCVPLCPDGAIREIPR